MLNGKTRMNGKILFLSLIVFFLFLLNVNYAIASIQYDSNETYDGYLPIFDNSICIQSFTPYQNYTVESLSVKLYRSGTFNSSIRVRIVEFQGSEIGIIKGTGWIHGTITTNDTSQWYTCSIASNPKVYSGETYAITLDAFGVGDSTHFIHWMANGTGNPYPNGTAYRSDNFGSSWTQYTNADFTFVLYGTAIIPYTYPTFIQIIEYYSIAGAVVLILGFSFHAVGNQLRGHGLAGFFIGSSMGLIIITERGMIPVWLTALLFAGGVVGIYFWFKGDGDNG